MHISESQLKWSIDNTDRLYKHLVKKKDKYSKFYRDLNRKLANSESLNEMDVALLFSLTSNMCKNLKKTIEVYAKKQQHDYQDKAIKTLLMLEELKANLLKGLGE